MDNNIIELLVKYIFPLWQFAVVIIFGVFSLTMLSGWFRRHRNPNRDKLNRTLIVAGVTLIYIIAGILVLPVNQELRIQLLTLLGLLLTLIMAFSSTSFVANAVAGLMLRGSDNIHPGDFIRVGDQFGRVTERALFHTEIQTEDRDLTTIPNLYLVSNPVTVVLSSGTIVSAEVSLGYGIDVDEIEDLLLKAAEEAGLTAPFVYIKTLGDFSIVYRIAGFLEEVKQLLTVRSVLRKNIIMTLHSANIEIVSPAFMNQRVFSGDHKVVAKSNSTAKRPNDDPLTRSTVETPESLVFDKAETAEKKEILLQRKQLLKDKIAKLKQSEQGDEDKDEINKKIEVLEHRLAYVRRAAEKVESELLAKQ